MAHFAQLENNIVIQVIVINNEVILNKDGVESEIIGIEFCQSLYGINTQWVQTSYSGSFRNKYAAAGDIYDSELDVFVDSTVENETNNENTANEL